MNFLDNLFITQSITDTDSGFEAVVRCNPNHDVYKAHFPGNPITPGACMLQEACVLIQEKMGRPLYLKKVKNIKYLTILIPSEGKEVKYDFSRVTEGETECEAQVVIADDSTVYTKMSLTFSYEQL